MKKKYGKSTNKKYPLVLFYVLFFREIYTNILFTSKSMVVSKFVLYKLIYSTVLSCTDRKVSLSAEPTTQTRARESGTAESNPFVRNKLELRFFFFFYRYPCTVYGTGIFYIPGTY